MIGKKLVSFLVSFLFLNSFSVYGEEVQVFPVTFVTDDLVDGIKFIKQKIHIKFTNLEDFPIICSKIVFNVDYFNGETIPVNKAGRAPLFYKNVKVPASGFISFPDSSQRIRDYVQDLIPHYQVGEVVLDKSSTQCVRDQQLFEEFKISPAIMLSYLRLGEVRYRRQSLNIRFENEENFPVYCPSLAIEYDYHFGNVNETMTAGSGTLIFKEVHIPANSSGPWWDRSQEIRDKMEGRPPNYQIGKIRLYKTETKCLRE